MHRALITVTALAVTALPALAETRDYSVDAFTHLDISEAILVEYEMGPAHSVTVEQTDGDYSDITIETKDDTLFVDRKSAKRGWRSNLSTDYRNGVLRAKVNGKKVPSYKVRVTSPTLSGIDASRSARVAASEIAVADLDLKTSSSADLIISGRADNVQLTASSSSDLEAANLSAGDLSIDASSSADVEARSVSGQRVRLSVSSSADVELELSGSANVDLEASSSADIQISGSCDRIIANASSSADVEGRDLVCKSATIRASSSADIELTVTETVDAAASSGGDVDILGNPPQRELHESSGGDVSIKS